MGYSRNVKRCQAAQSEGEGLYRVADAGGLNIEVDPSGSRRWRIRYRFAGKQKMLSLGVYPEVSLADARERRDDTRKTIAAGTDPSLQRRIEKMNGRLLSATTFESVAEEWLAGRDHLADSTREKVLWLLDTMAFPWLGIRPIKEINSPEMLSVLRRVEALGKLETTQRPKRVCADIPLCHRHRPSRTRPNWRPARRAENREGAAPCQYYRPDQGW